MLILVVDDEDRHPFHVETWLRIKWSAEWGRTDPVPEVRGVRKYHEALKVFAAEGSRVRVVLTDVMISREKGENGPDLYWFVREKWPEVKVFVTSAYLDVVTRAFTGYDDLPPQREGNWEYLDGLDRDWSELNWLHRALFGCDAPEESP